MPRGGWAGTITEVHGWYNYGAWLYTVRWSKETLEAGALVLERRCGADAGETVEETELIWEYELEPDSGGAVSIEEP